MTTGGEGESVARGGSFRDRKGDPEPDASGSDAGRVKRETPWKARQNTTFGPGPSGARRVGLVGSGRDRASGADQVAEFQRRSGVP
jgi:hypothetical protein